MTGWLFIGGTAWGVDHKLAQRELFAIYHFAISDTCPQMAAPLLISQLSRLNNKVHKKLYCKKLTGPLSRNKINELVSIWANKHYNITDIDISLGSLMLTHKKIFSRLKSPAEI